MFTKIQYKLILFLLFIFPFQGFAQLTATPDGRRLREIVADKFSDGNLLIGGTSGEWAFGTATGEIMNREFSYVTPENDFKQPQIHPDNTNNWSWSRSDNWKSHVLSKGQTLRMHGPISPQCSNWAKDDNRTAEELETNLRAFMQALCERYNNQANFEYMDVVNETVITGEWHKNKTGTGWEVPWYIIGQDTDENKTPLYIKYAFEIATQYAPDVKLLYNQHERTLSISSWNLIKKTISYLRNQGLRVDAIGWQAHLEVGWEKEEGQTQLLRDLIDWAHQNNLEFHITEQSVYINSNTESEYQKQADTYQAVIDILIEKSANGKVGWNTWHIDEGHGSQQDKFPAIFDINYKAKPAYYAIQRALETKGDYTSLHNISINVKNTESGKPIENCKVVFNNEIKYSDINGDVLFKASANQYNIAAEKEHYATAGIDKLSVYSDTIFNVFLDSTELLHNVTFEVEDIETGEHLSTVNIEIDSKIQKTNSDGNASFILNPGIYPTSFEKLNYTFLQSDFKIQSDTTFKVKMKRSHADIKFRLKSGSQPINNALVIFAGDTLYSNSLGICTFRSYAAGSEYNFIIEKEYFNQATGSITAKTDTTLDFQLQKNVANIEFILTGDKEKIENAMLVAFNDTTAFNTDGIVRLFNVTKNQKFTYQILSNNYPDYEDSVIPENDTTLQIQLIYTNTENIKKSSQLRIFPNPADTYLTVENNFLTGYIEIFAPSGVKVKNVPIQAESQRVDISDLKAGLYLVKIYLKDKTESHAFIKQ
jgi:GH35 family endo-1,4-beta-xylanase